MKQYQIDMYKKSYPPGTEVELISMEDDPHAVLPGTKGTVDFVDAIGTIHITWENGRTLGVCPDVDRLRRVEPSAEKIPARDQLMQAAQKAGQERPAKVAAPPDKGKDR